MTKAIEELPSIIDCSRKDCEGKIAVIDSYYISQAGVPQIGVKCPECGKVTVLSKAKTIAYAKEYPQIQQDIDKASGYKLTQIDEEEEFGDKVMHIIEAFGYGGTKDKQRNIIIRSMIDMVPGYANQQALNDLLLSRGIKARDANQISQLACLEDGSPTIMSMMPGMQQPGMQQPGMQQPGMQQQPYYHQPYPEYSQPYQQQYPQPPYQQQPQVVVQQPAPPAHNSDDEITIIEKLDDDGKVVERTIRQPKTEHQDVQPTQTDQISQFKELINVMVDAGIVNTNQPDAPQPLTADDLAATVAAYLEHDTPEKGDSRVDDLLSEMKALRADMDQKDKDAMLTRINQLEEESGKPRHDLSDDQYSENIRKDVEGMRVDAVKETLNTIVKPIFELQANQTKLQTLMMIRQLEQQDHAAPGSYAAMFGSNAIPDESVKSDLGRWHERADRVAAQ
jgi:hypothetical protein